MTYCYMYPDNIRNLEKNTDIGNCCTIPLQYSLLYLLQQYVAYVFKLVGLISSSYQTTRIDTGLDSVFVSQSSTLCRHPFYSEVSKYVTSWNF